MSFAVALSGALLAAAVLALVRARRGTSTLGERGPGLQAAALLVVAALAVPLAGMLAWLPLPGGSLTSGAPTSTVAVIQGDVPRAGLDFNAQRLGAAPEWLLTAVGAGAVLVAARPGLRERRRRRAAR